MIKTLFQVKPEPGAMKVINYSPLTVLTKDTLKPELLDRPAGGEVT